MKLEDVKQTSNIYMTLYEIVGRRDNGSYLVRAESKTAANNVVRKLSKDYVRIRSQLMTEFLGADYDDYYKNDPSFQKDLAKLKNNGDYVHFEEGT